jgi:hypothetical protein
LIDAWRHRGARARGGIEAGSKGSKWQAGRQFEFMRSALEKRVTGSLTVHPSRTRSGRSGARQRARGSRRARGARAAARHWFILVLRDIARPRSFWSRSRIDAATAGARRRVQRAAKCGKCASKSKATKIHARCSDILHDTFSSEHQ